MAGVLGLVHPCPGSGSASTRRTWTESVTSGFRLIRGIWALDRVQCQTQRPTVHELLKLPFLVIPAAHQLARHVKFTFSWACPSSSVMTPGSSRLAHTRDANGWRC